MSQNDADATAERTSDRELVVTHILGEPARLAFEAWARPELFRRWWAPDSCGLTIVSYEADVRTGGSYRLEMRLPDLEETMAFYGRYVEVVPGARIVWTNDEGDEEGPVTSVTFEDRNGGALVTVHELYPSEAALDEAIASGSTSGWAEQLKQLNSLVADLRAGGA